MVLAGKYTLMKQYCRLPKGKLNCFVSYLSEIDNALEVFYLDVYFFMAGEVGVDRTEFGEATGGGGGGGG